MGTWYDLRVDGVVQERLGLSELRQQLTNVLEGGAGLVEVAPTGGLPVEVKKSKKARSSGS